MCRSRKYPYQLPGRSLEILKDLGPIKAKFVLKESMMLNLTSMPGRKGFKTETLWRGVWIFSSSFHFAHTGQETAMTGQHHLETRVKDLHPFGRRNSWQGGVARADQEVCFKSTADSLSPSYLESFGQSCSVYLLMAILSS